MRSLPNILTVIRILLTPVFVYCLLSDSLQIFAALIFLFASVTDWYDGYLARKYGYTSAWGKFLDPLADKVLVLSAFFSLVYLGVVKLWMVMVIMLRDFVVTTLRSYTMSHGKPMMTNFFAKFKTVSQMIMIGLILIFVSLQSGLATWQTDYRDHINTTVTVISEYNVIYAGMLCVTMLTAVSGIVYLYQNRESLRRLAMFSFFKNS